MNRFDSVRKMVSRCASDMKSPWMLSSFSMTPLMLATCFSASECIGSPCMWSCIERICRPPSGALLPCVSFSSSLIASRLKHESKAASSKMMNRSFSCSNAFIAPGSCSNICCGFASPYMGNAIAADAVFSTSRPVDIPRRSTASFAMSSHNLSTCVFCGAQTRTLLLGLVSSRSRAFATMSAVLPVPAPKITSTALPASSAARTFRCASLGSKPPPPPPPCGGSTATSKPTRACASIRAPT